MSMGQWEVHVPVGEALDDATIETIRKQAGVEKLVITETGYSPEDQMDYFILEEPMPDE